MFTMLLFTPAWFEISNTPVWADNVMVATICVSVQLITVQGHQLSKSPSVTEPGVDPKFVPVMVTSPPGHTVVGLMLVMFGDC